MKLTKAELEAAVEQAVAVSLPFFYVGLCGKDELSEEEIDQFLELMAPWVPEHLPKEARDAVLRQGYDDIRLGGEHVPQRMGWATGKVKELFPKTSQQLAYLRSLMDAACVDQKFLIGEAEAIVTITNDFPGIPYQSLAQALSINVGEAYAWIDAMTEKWRAVEGQVEQQANEKENDRQREDADYLKVHLNGQVAAEGKTVAELYDMLLTQMCIGGKIEKLPVPFATGSKRYLIAKEPVHPSGKPFRIPVEFGGYVMEAHKGREAAVADAEKWLTAGEL